MEDTWYIVNKSHQNEEGIKENVEQEQKKNLKKGNIYAFGGNKGKMKWNF